MLWIFRIVAFICFSTPFIIKASLPTEIDLSEAIRRSWSLSEQLRAQRIQVELASKDRWRRFLINEPQVSYGTTDDSTAEIFGVQLAFAMPGKAFAIADLDQAKELSSKAELSAKKYDLAKAVAQSYLDCASANESFELIKITNTDLQTVSRSLKVKYEMGHATQAEKIGAELQASQAEMDLESAKDKAKSQCKKLSLLMGKDSADQDYSPRLPDDLDSSLISELGDESADQERAAAAIKVANVTERLAGWSQIPDLSFSATRNHYYYPSGSPSGAAWTTNYSVAITLPILFPFIEMNEIHRAKSQAMIDRNIAELQKINADSDQLDASQEYTRSRKRLKQLRGKDLALAEALLEGSLSSYRSGKLGYAELVLYRKMFLDLKNQEIQLRTSVISAHLRCLNKCEALSQGSIQ